MMDDMVRDYLRVETKNPSFMLKEDKEPEPRPKHYIPLAADKHQKHNFYTNTKKEAKSNYGTTGTGYFNEGEKDGLGRQVFNGRAKHPNVGTAQVKTKSEGPSVLRTKALAETESILAAAGKPRKRPPKKKKGVGIEHH
jgi:hypothetical protein